MAISRPFLLALLGVVLLGASALAVQNARDSADSDATPAAVHSEPAPAPTPTNTAAADTLKAAFNLGQLVAAGLLDADRVRAVLLAAALEAGNPEAKARATITSGLRGGAAKPRQRRNGAA